MIQNVIKKLFSVQGGKVSNNLPYFRDKIQTKKIHLYDSKALSVEEF